MKKYIFILFIALLVSSDSLWACAKSLMPLPPLIHINSEGHIEVARVLLENGALNVNLQDTDDPRVHIEVVRVLLENGANVNHQDKFGETALMDTSHEGYIKVVSLLKEAGVIE